MVKTETIYVGNVKEAQHKFGNYLRLGFKVDDLSKMQDYVNNGWVNIKLLSKKDNKGFYMVVDTYKPKKEEKQENTNSEANKYDNKPFAGEEENLEMF